MLPVEGDAGIERACRGILGDEGYRSRVGILLQRIDFGVEVYPVKYLLDLGEGEEGLRYGVHRTHLGWYICESGSLW